MKALVPLAPGFEEIEAITVIDILRRAGVEVTVAGTVSGTITGAHQTRHLADTDLEQVQAREFDIVILPGGVEGTENLKKDARVASILKRQREKGGWTAAICAAPTILEEHGLLGDEPAVCYPSMQSQLKPSRLRAQERVVVADHLITSMAPGTALEFAIAIVRQLVGTAKADEVAQGVCAARP